MLYKLHGALLASEHCIVKIRVHSWSKTCTYSISLEYNSPTLNMTSSCKACMCSLWRLLLIPMDWASSTYHGTPSLVASAPQNTVEAKGMRFGAWSVKWQRGMSLTWERCHIRMIFAYSYQTLLPTRTAIYNS